MIFSKNSFWMIVGEILGDQYSLKSNDDEVIYKRESE